MKKAIKHAGLMLLVACLLFAGLPTGVFAARTTAEVQKEIDEKKQQLQKLEEDIGRNKNNREAAEAALADYEAQYNGLVALVDEQEVLIQNTEENLDGKTRELSDTIAGIRENNELFEQRLIAIYEINSTNAMLQSLLAVRSFSEMMQVMDAMKRISKNDTELLNELGEKKERFEEQKKELETTIAGLDEELQRLQENRDWCEGKMAEMRYAMSSADAAIAANEEKSAETQAEMEKLKAELAAIFNESQNKGSKKGDGTVRYNGPLTWPVPSSSTIPSGGYFGDPRANTGWHYGIDISAGEGSAIVAAADGTVITAAYHYSYGNYIILDHGAGLRTLYAHCSALYVGAGSAVSAGSTIAGVGSTGDSSGNHLHFEVHEHGQRQNPLASGYLTP